MRKTAGNILIELENSRQHYHHVIKKHNWERAIDSACQNSIRMLTEAEGASDSANTIMLAREVEILKANTEKTICCEVLDMEKDADKYEMQALLTAQIDVISSLHSIINMNESEAISHAKSVITRLLQSSTATVSNIVKPDGSFKVSEAAPPTRRGTPRRKKNIRFSESHAAPAPVMQALKGFGPQIFASPSKPSPRRKKSVFGKKGVSFTPRKKSPSKRCVRWRDDTESGTLAEFEKTPQKQNSSPGESETETLPLLPTSPKVDLANIANEPFSSSPIPAAPVAFSEINPKSRFQAGFLTKKSEGSPNLSPLQDINTKTYGNRSSSNNIPVLSNKDTSKENGNSSGSETENNRYHIGRIESAKISKSLKRSGTTSRVPSGGHDYLRNSRRKSPSSISSMTASPPNENALFTASHARRMVSSQRESLHHPSVLSPRTAYITKHSRQISNGVSGGSLRVSAVSDLLGHSSKLRASSMGGERFTGNWR
ncbi:hypothetical protein K3495_g9357 [Podosphaera aphanis]|nr:hypothetical protein K3495_g9357 [Podosphaera aphanis]